MAEFVDAAPPGEDEEEEDFEEVSDEEKVAIATHFLLSSPPGQIHDVLADVRNMVPAHLLGDDMLQRVFRKYNRSTYQAVRAGDGGLVIICDAGKIDDTHFIDVSGTKVYGVDHVGQTADADDCRPVDDNEMDASLETQRVSVAKALQGYVARQFGGGVDARQQAIGGECCAAVYAREGTLTAIISADKINLRNYWAGKWCSTYTIANLLGGAGGATLAGEVKQVVHYFEEGNLQLHNEKKLDPAQALNNSGGQDVGDVVAEAVCAFEAKMQGALENMYTNMGDETFKEMRRILPVTGSKYDWSGNAMRMALNRGTKKN